MMKFTFCPSFSIYSFIFFVTVVDVIVYLTTLIVSFTSGGGFNSGQFLGPDVLILDDFGAENPYKLYCNLQVQRFVAPIFLHASFLHIVVRSSFSLNRVSIYSTLM
jgi:membrane associated rhomboid family serine protease